MRTIQPLTPQENDDFASRVRHSEAAQKAAELMRGQIKNIYTDTTAAAQVKPSRPDPSTNRVAYEAWYYSLSKAEQQAEWDLYYSQNEQPQTVHVEASHAVSQSYAQHHAIPEQAYDQHRATSQMQNHQEAPISQQVVKRSYRNPFRSIITALALSLFFTFAFYNEIVIGQVSQYISPSSTISTPIILDPSASINVGQEARIIIPKINVDVPVVYDVDSLEESAIQEGLNDGVVDYNYPGTVNPGEIGNNVIVGHSSNNFLNSGKYKFAFVLLDRLEEGDTFMLHYEGTRYVYKITNKEVVEPDDFSNVTQTSSTPLTTLITCTPPGTSWRRLIIQGEQISPNAETAQMVSTPTSQSVPETSVPGNAPSLWSQLFN